MAVGRADLPPDWPSRRAAGRAFVTLAAALTLAGCGVEARDPGPAAAAAPAEAPASPTLPPGAAATTSPAELAATGPVELRLRFSGDTWVEAVVDGRDRVSELHIAGEEMVVEAQREIVLTVGNAGAVEASVNGRRYPLPASETGEVVRDLVITAPPAP